MKSIILITCLLFANLLFAQQRVCGFDHANHFHTTQGQHYLTAFEQNLRQYLTEKRPGKRQRSDEQPYQIPVIVHLVHNGEAIGEGPNLDAAQVYSQLEVLNEDFGRANANLKNTRDRFVSLAADARIEFVLAMEDPDGKPLAEPGIHRYHGGRTSWGSAEIKTELQPKTQFDPYRYLNIWVLNFSNSIMLGYGQWPMGGIVGLEDNQDPNTDGVVIGYGYFGSREKFPEGNYADFIFDKGRTTTHEIGHWLGLRHTFESCSPGDYVEDTPAQRDSSRGCPAEDETSCDNLVLWENYMDYTDDACMSLFTHNQVERMHAVIKLDSMRNSLVNNGRIRLAGLAEQLTIYPNPSQGKFTVDLTNWKPVPMYIEVVDLTGKVLYRDWLISGVKTGINLSHLAPSTYLLRMRSDGQLATETLVIY